MPGFDGTGPRGMGPMTGGGRGFCSPRGIVRGRGMGMDYGFRRGRGFGPGWGLGYQAPYPYGPTVNPYAPSMSREEKLNFLRYQAQAVKEQLDQIEAKMSELGKQEV